MRKRLVSSVLAILMVLSMMSILVEKMQANNLQVWRS